MACQLPSDREMILDYVCGPSATTGVLKCGRVRRRKSHKDAVLEPDSQFLALNMEEEIQIQGWRWLLESGENKLKNQKTRKWILP